MNVWRDRLHRWSFPLARWCPLSPNTITLIAVALNITSALLMYDRQFLLAIVFVSVGGFLDAFDGIVARVQEKSSRYGDFLDHFFDRVSDSVLLTGWLLGNEVRIELTAGAIIIVMLNGYAGTQIEATWQKRDYEGLGRGEYILGLILFPSISHILYTNGWQHLRFASLTIAEWMTLVAATGSLLAIVQRFRLAAKLEQSD